jgi:hypothetical protein
LNCPFPRCRYDEEGGIAGFMRRQRDGELRRLRQEGLVPSELAARFNVSLRSVYRILSIDGPTPPKVAEPAPIWMSGVAA